MQNTQRKAVQDPRIFTDWSSFFFPPLPYSEYGIRLRYLSKFCKETQYGQQENTVDNPITSGFLLYKTD
jgi:hypothetical protein